jgi:hypothetical protein
MIDAFKGEGMRVRGGVAVLAVAVALAAAGCSSNGNSSSSTTTTTTSAAATTTAHAHTFTAQYAQHILREIVNPATPPERAAKLVQSTDPQIGDKIHAFAQAASQGGYTPEVFTVTAVTVNGNTANATVQVASPHAPQPVSVPMTFVHDGKHWKLGADSTTGLLAMGQGPQH